MKTRLPSPREVEVISLMAEGMSNDEIGLVLGIAGTTVKVHARRIACKLGVAGRSSARAATVCQALRKGWIK